MWIESTITWYRTRCSTRKLRHSALNWAHVCPGYVRCRKWLNLTKSWRIFSHQRSGAALAVPAKVRFTSSKLYHWVEGEWVVVLRLDVLIFQPLRYNQVWIQTLRWILVYRNVRGGKVYQQPANGRWFPPGSTRFPWAIVLAAVLLLK